MESGLLLKAGEEGTALGKKNTAFLRSQGYYSKCIYKEKKNENICINECTVVRILQELMRVKKVEVDSSILIKSIKKLICYVFKRKSRT